MQSFETLADGVATPWHTAYWVAGGLDRYLGPRLYGKPLIQGPVADVLAVTSAASLTSRAIGLLPQSVQQLKTAAAAGGAPAAMRALVQRPAGTPALPGALAKAFRDIAGAKSIPAAAAAAVQPAMATAFSLSIASGAAGAAEYLMRHGARGLASTQQGRGVAIGALTAGTMATQLLAHGAPLGAFAFVGSAALFVLLEINGRGWLDDMLGS